MITIIGTTQRLLSYVMGKASLSEVDTPGEWLAYRGTISHEDPSESSEALVVLTGNAPGIAAEATRWAAGEFDQQILLSFAYGSAANDVSLSAHLALVTSCIRVDGKPIRWSEGYHSPPIRTSQRAYAVARKTVEHLGTDFRAGDIVSTLVPTSTVDLKQWLNDAFGVQAVDRDAYDIAEACTASNIHEFMIIRSVLDPVNALLPSFAPRMGMRPRGFLWPRALAYVARHPSETRSTFKLVGHADAGRRVIGKFVPRFLTEWSDMRTSLRSRNGA